MDEMPKENDVVSDEIKVESTTAKSGLIIWIALLVLVVVNAIGGYWLWSQQQAISTQVSEDRADLVVPAQNDNIDYQQSLQAVENKLQATITDLAAEQTALSQRVADLNNEQPLSQQNAEYYWTIAEVNYLLNVANQRALLANDAQGAREAIVLAANNVEHLADPRLQPLRDLLEEEKLALAAVNKVDVEGVSAKLQSMLNSVDKLQVLMAKSINQVDQEEEVNAEDWQGVFGKVWHEVKSLVVIRHQQEGATAVLVPEQRYFLYQNLKLKLETARLALLKGQANVFDQSLVTSEQWLQQYFVGDERDAMVALITELKTENIEVILPDVSLSLTWLRGFEQ